MTEATEAEEAAAWVAAAADLEESDAIWADPAATQAVYWVEHWFEVRAQFQKAIPLQPSRWSSHEEAMASPRELKAWL